MVFTRHDGFGSFAKIGVILCVSFLALGSVRAETEKHKLACIYYDKENPHEGMSALRPGLSSLWAKSFHGEDIYVVGRLRNGFLEIDKIIGNSSGILSFKEITTYNNSYDLAQEFCRNALRLAFPADHGKKEVVYLAAKPSFLSLTEIPLVFGEYSKTFIRALDKLIVFGDSLSDQGNLKRWLRFFPQAPYFAGRFSNERIWVDYLQKMTGIAVQNWAVGGSVSEIFADPQVSALPFLRRAKIRAKEMASGCLGAEITRYEKKSLQGGPLLDAASTLFSVWIGGNDYISVLEHETNINTFIDNPHDSRIGSTVVIGRVTDNVIKNIKRLYELGARNFIVGNIPDMGKFPRLLELDTYHLGRNETRQQRLFALSTKMTEITELHNNTLKKKLDSFKQEHPNCLIVYLDVFTGLEEAINSIDMEDEISDFDYGLNEDMVQEVCYESQSILINKACMGVSSDTYQMEVCEQPDMALFWDGVHPSTFGHCLISSLMHHVAAQNGIFSRSSLENYLDLCPIENHGQS